MNIVLLSITNIEKSTKKSPPPLLSHTPSYICTSTMQTPQKGRQKVKKKERRPECFVGLHIYCFYAVNSVWALDSH